MGIRGGGVEVRGASVAIPATLVFLAFVLGGVWAEPVRAGVCSALTERVREEEPGASGLPDCRAYEQVSPVAKNGVDAIGGPEITQVSAAGDAVGFWSLVPFPGLVSSAATAPTYLGSRSREPDRWSTEGLAPPAPGSGGHGLELALTEDLTKTIVSARNPSLAPGATPGSNLFVRDNATSTYQLLEVGPVGGDDETAFVDAAAGDTRILFETKTVLSTANVPPVPGFQNLYEWNEAMPMGARLSLAGVVPPAGEPACGGASEPAFEVPAEGATSGGVGGAHGGSYTQHTISPDGSRVFFTDKSTSFVYMREPMAGRTVRVSAGVSAAEWQGATPSDSFVFYTEGPELYRFNVGEGKIQAITSGAEGALGTLGFSDDGSYVYFVAPGILAANKNGHNEEAVQGGANLYEWHEGVTTFIALMSQATNWVNGANLNEQSGPASGNKSSRVTPDGRTVMFSASSPLTSYPNNNMTELYLYDATSPLSASNPVCVSCNPSGAPATSGAVLARRGEVSPYIQLPRRTTFLTHNLSDSGSRVFFQSQEALVSGDVNGQNDVYEWERVGTGSCESTSAGFSEQDGGCLYLISTGQRMERSYFGNADPEGKNVFFFTREPLVGQDKDENFDLYDARAEGGIEAQNPPPLSVPCAEESACRGPSSSVPSVFGSPSSAMFSGAGNLPAPPAVFTPPKKTVTRTERLAKALRACRSKPRSKRSSCEATARKRYGHKSGAKKATWRRTHS
jgi:hypothetical protein